MNYDDESYVTWKVESFPRFRGANEEASRRRETSPRFARDNLSSDPGPRTTIPTVQVPSPTFPAYAKNFAGSLRWYIPIHTKNESLSPPVCGFRNPKGCVRNRK